MTNDQFISAVGEMARNDVRILPSLTIAQAILESGWGKSGLTKRANALFGIKATSGWKGKVYSVNTKECYDGINFVDEVAVFRAYDSWAESVQDHTDFLCGLSRYSAVVGEKDYKTACLAIQAAGYATDPSYAHKLISLIEKYHLYEYDSKPESAAATATYTVKANDNLTKIAKKYGVTIDAIVAINWEKYPKITKDYIQVGWVLNIPRTHKVKAGDTLSEIAEKYKTSINVILSVNKKRYPKITKDYIQAGWVLVV